MGNPGSADAAAHRRQAGGGGATRRYPSLFRVAGYPAAAPGDHPLVQAIATTSIWIPKARRSSPSAPKRAWPTWRWRPCRSGRCGSGAQSGLPDPSLRLRDRRGGYPPCAACPRAWTSLPSCKRRSRTPGPEPKMLVLNFPGNPTTQCVDLEFFEKVVAVAREHQIWVVHDLAYADHRVRRLQGAVDPQVPGRQGGGGGVFLPVQELQHAGLARRLHVRQPERWWRPWRG